VAVLLNLSRDQLDRFEEVGSHVGRWADAIALVPGTHIVANAADPLVVAAVHRARPAAHHVTWVDAGAAWRADSPLCPACGHAWDMTREPWSCEVCSLTMPTARWRLAEGAVVDAAGRSLPLDLSVPGRAARSNAIMALATADLLGVPAGVALEPMAAVRSIDGRYLDLQAAGRSVRLLLAKNPAGWLEVLHDAAPDSCAMILGINARTADGTDPSWLWDVPFELLRGRDVIVCGERALDLSVRLHYGDVQHELAADLSSALRLTSQGQRVCVAANYTAFVGARAELRAAAA
jgi:UDP-N-acetylmuramyl tripeptide synthase